MQIEVSQTLTLTWGWKSCINYYGISDQVSLWIVYFKSHLLQKKYPLMNSFVCNWQEHMTGLVWEQNKAFVQDKFMP